MFYSTQTGGFYDTAIHGDNIPADAVEITNEQHAALLEGQSQGQQIVAEESGYPILQDPPPPSPNDIIKGQIAALEATVTPRRLREAVLSGPGSTWLANVEAQIAALRVQLQ